MSLDKVGRSVGRDVDIVGINISLVVYCESLGVEIICCAVINLLADLLLSTPTLQLFGWPKIPSILTGPVALRCASV